MDVKVLCGCGAKFQFPIEPVNGRMPCPVKCPACGADTTALANQVIAQKLAADQAPAAAEPSQPAPARVMHVSAPAAPSAASPRPIHVAPAPPTPPTQGRPVATIATASSAAPAPVEAQIPGVPYCPRHGNEIAVAECFVCQKPICSKCMEQFGFLCSSYCKGQAEAKKMKVPVFAGQVHQKAAAERKGHNFIIIASIALAATLFGAYVWYWFIGSKPKSAFKIDGGPGTPFLHTEWIGEDKFFAVTPAHVTMYNSDDGSEVWRYEMPAGEIKMTKVGDDEWEPSFYPRVKLVSKDIWIGLPSRLVRIDGTTGKKKQEIALASKANSYQVGETHFLAVSSNETNDSKALMRIALSNGQIESTFTPATTGARRIAGVTRFMPGLGNTSISKMDPDDEDFSDFSTTTYGLDRDYLFTGQNVAHFTRTLVEERIAVVASTKPKTGALLIDNPNIRASQGLEAAEEFFNSNVPDTKIDQSLYAVTIRRYFGGAPEWTGQIAGRPFFYSLKTVDYLVGGNTIIVFNKNNQKLWEAKLTYSISPKYWDDEETGGPALELGNRLLVYDQGVLTAFDVKKGQVEWRVNSVGISHIAPDGEGNVYLSSTTAGPEQIKYSQQISLSERVYPMIVKVELKSGKVLWQSPRVGSSVMVTQGIVYATSEQVAGFQMIAAASRGESAPVNWRLFRLDPGNGKDLFEHHRLGVPIGVQPRHKRILLQYPDHLRMLKYL